MKRNEEGLANGHGHRMGQDEADAAAAMTKLAAIATMSSISSSSLPSKSSAFDRRCHPESLVPPTPPPKKRKIWNEKPMENGMGGRSVSGGMASTTADVTVPFPGSGEKASSGSSVGVDKRDGGGMHGVGDRVKENGGAGEGESRGSKGKGGTEEGSANHKRKDAGGGRNASRKKGKVCCVSLE